jgi:hypothetical protein
LRVFLFARVVWTCLRARVSSQSFAAKTSKAN